jgi:hypothetical protein
MGTYGIDNRIKIKTSGFEFDASFVTLIGL